MDLSKEIAALVAEITDLKESLAVINEHIAASKNQRKCPNCDAVIPKNSLFCNICGAKLVNDFTKAKEEEPVAAEDITSEQAMADDAENTEE